MSLTMIKKVFFITIVLITLQAVFVPIVVAYATVFEIESDKHQTQDGIDNFENSMADQIFSENFEGNEHFNITDESDIEQTDQSEDKEYLNDSESVELFRLGPNLFQNTGFNFNNLNGGTIANWQMTGSTTPVNVLTRNVTLNGYNSGGSDFIRLSDNRFFLGGAELRGTTFHVSNQNNTGTLILSQTIDTVPGRTYEVSGSFRSRNGNVGYALTAFDGEYVVNGTNSLNILSFTSAATSWFTRTMQFTATGSKTTIGYRISGSASTQAGMQNPTVAAVQRNLRLQANPESGGSPSSNTSLVTPGANAILTANPNSNYKFVRWESLTGASIISDPTLERTTITMGNTDDIIQAVYEKLPFKLTLEASPSLGGNPAYHENEIQQGAETTIYANPNEGYQFVHWELVSGTGSSIASMTDEKTTFKMGSQDAVVRAVYEEAQFGEVYIYHTDTDGEKLMDPVVITGAIGEYYETNPIDIENYELVITPENASGYFEEDAISVVYIYDIETVAPLDPLDPEAEVEPENKPELPEDQGLLSIDFVSSFTFGSHVISATDQTYYAQPQRLLNEDGAVNESEERPNYVQVSDRRPENDRNGWQLAVTQNTQFTTENDHTLFGAQLQLMNQQLVTVQGGKEPSLQATNPLALVPGQKRTLVRAEGTEGTGTWIYRFGDAETAQESIALHVPKGANPHAESYKTTLTWELSAVPGN